MLRDNRVGLCTFFFWSGGCWPSSLPCYGEERQVNSTFVCNKKPTFYRLSPRCLQSTQWVLFTRSDSISTSIKRQCSALCVSVCVFVAAAFSLSDAHVFNTTVSTAGQHQQQTHRLIAFYLTVWAWGRFLFCCCWFWLLFGFLIYLFFEEEEKKQFENYCVFCCGVVVGLGFLGGGGGGSLSNINGQFIFMVVSFKTECSCPNEVQLHEQQVI